MNRPDGPTAHPARDDSLPFMEPGNPSAEHPDHPVRQLIRRVRAAHGDARTSHESGLRQQVQPDASTRDQECDTPGNTQYEELQSLASMLESHSRLPDIDAVPADLPNQIGRFRIKRILGSGGFGWVLLADDPQLNRPVALKVPRLDTLVSPTGRSRFLREARAAALLSHPGLVSVYEAGQLGPLLYIAFEWIDGQSLSQWLPGHRAELTSHSVARMMSAMAHAVQHAHQRGIVHRDLKPSNILIRNPSAETRGDNPDELAERVKIADFGLAFHAENDGSLTRSGALMGTPRYLAPEQIQSRGAQNDPMIDVYGLGAVMYELLTGQPPFSGPTLAAIVRSVEQDPPVAPRKLNPAVPGDLEAVCLKCLEKRPAQRYSSAAALAEDLERFTEGFPVRARRPHFVEKALRWVGRNQLVSFAFALATLSLTAGLFLALSQAHQARTSLAENQQQRLRAERHRDRAKAAVDTLLSDVAESLEPIPQMQPLQRRLLQIALDHERAAMADEGDDPESLLRVAESAGRIADLQFRLGDFDASLGSCEEVLQLLEQFSPSSSGQQQRCDVFQSKSYLLKSRILLEQQNPLAAGDEIQKVLVPTAASSGSTPEITRLRATAFSLLGRSLRDRGATVAAELAFLDSIATLETLAADVRTGGDESDIISMMSMIGGLRYTAGKYDEAAEIWKETADREINLDPGLPQHNILRGNRAAGLANLAMACSFKKEFDSALAYYHQSNEQYQELCNQFPLHLGHAQGRLTALTGRSVALQNMGDAPGAIASYQEAVAWGEQLVQRFGPQPRLLMETSRTLGNYGNVLQFSGDGEAAQEAWSRGLVHVRKNMELQPDNGSNRSDLAFALGNLAAFHLQQNRLAEADPLIESAVAESERAMQLLPGNQKVINACRVQLANRVLLLCLRNDHEAGLATVDRIAGLQSDHADTLVFAARTAARCQTAVSGNLHELFGNPDDEAVAERYAVRALDLLRSARDLGFDEFDSLRRQPELSQLATRPEFAELLPD